MIPLSHYLILATLLFCIGLAVTITRKNAIAVLIGLELMLNAANINLVAFSRYDGVQLQGQMFALFVIVVAAAEAAVALALVVRVYGYYKIADLDKLNRLKG
ncbi:NADH-quinone oxidoreductase subunit NuoK [Cesiribacter sp. SM1]|uniref:NADH-quinone oxidoreductase subunit NuoK n=1 Tax=Cesiribacter sp. SM1 TaxID=2861196 RepID=UPI0021038954|nr:NADH-quinone oxidoreductase subunit NuoK [Cesiribacter sp. SM1]